MSSCFLSELLLATGFLSLFLLTKSSFLSNEFVLDLLVVETLVFAGLSSLLSDVSVDAVVTHQFGVRQVC